MTTPKRDIRLSKRDRSILAHIAEFRMTTFEFLRIKFFVDKHSDAVKSCVRRLALAHIKAEPLDSQRVYYRLTRDGARAIDVPLTTARRLGLQARVERYALQWFICGQESVRRRLVNPRTTPTLFDVGSDRLPRSNFYLEATTDGAPRVGFVVVDHGAHPRRTVQKAMKKVQRFLRKGWCDEYIRIGKFTLTVLTPSERSKRMIERQLPPYLQKILKESLQRFATPQSMGGLPFQIVVEHVPLLDVLLLRPKSSPKIQQKGTPE